MWIRIIKHIYVVQKPFWKAENQVYFWFDKFLCSWSQIRIPITYPDPTFHYNADPDPAEWCRSDRHFKKSFDLFEVCDGDTVKAHKLVLSACSPLFRWAADTGDQYPVFILYSTVPCCSPRAVTSVVDPVPLRQKVLVPTGSGSGSESGSTALPGSIQSISSESLVIIFCVKNT